MSLRERVWAAAQAALERPTVRRGVDAGRTLYADLREEMELRFGRLEAHLWRRIRALEEELRRADRQRRRAQESDRYYQTLALRPGANLDQVKAAWRAQMRLHHPDRHAQSPEAEARAHRRTQEINHAYSELVALLTGRESRRAR